MKLKLSQVLTIFALAGLIFMAAFAALNLMAPPMDVQAAAVTGTSTTQSLGATVNYTGSATYNGTGVNVLNYGAADCYFYLDMVDSDTQTVTAKIQHAVNSGQWVDLATIGTQTADGTVFTTAIPYGRFIRAQLAISTITSPVTSSVSCVLKNRN